ncbi:MAG: hypothetical protein Q9204_006770, partial [Flavoplaca sp. TL-2023a]
LQEINGNEQLADHHRIALKSSSINSEPRTILSYVSDLEVAVQTDSLPYIALCVSKYSGYCGPEHFNTPREGEMDVVMVPIPADVIIPRSEGINRDV